MSQPFVKDPDAILDFEVDWSLWLKSGDTIVTSTWIVPTGITKVSDTSDATTATIWLSGGAVGSTVSVTNRVTTADSRTDDRTLTLFIRDR